MVWDSILPLFTTRQPHREGRFVYWLRTITIIKFHNLTKWGFLKSEFHDYLFIYQTINSENLKNMAYGWGVEICLAGFLNYLQTKPFISTQQYLKLEPNDHPNQYFTNWFGYNLPFLLQILDKILLRYNYFVQTKRAKNVK